MSHENDSERDSESNSSRRWGHIYVSPDALPDDTYTAEQWVQRVTLLADEIDTLNRGVWNAIVAKAPVLMRDNELLAYLMGTGFLAQGIELTGRKLLERIGMPAIDPVEEQRRLIRDQLAKPDCPEDLRDHLLAVLGRLNDTLPSRPTSSPTDDFPEGGFTIGE